MAFDGWNPTPPCFCSSRIYDGGHHESSTGIDQWWNTTVFFQDLFVKACWNQSVWNGKGMKRILHRCNVSMQKRDQQKRCDNKLMKLNFRRFSQKKKTFFCLKLETISCLIISAWNTVQNPESPGTRIFGRPTGDSISWPVRMASEILKNWVLICLIRWFDRIRLPQSQDLTFVGVIIQFPYFRHGILILNWQMQEVYLLGNKSKAQRWTCSPFSLMK